MKPLTDQQVKDMNEAEEIAETTMRWVNTANRDALDAFVSYLHRNHRTLQQGLFRSVVAPLIKLWAADYADGAHDARNEATTKTCAQIVEKLDNFGIVPLI